MDKEFIENLIKDVDDPEFFKEAIRMIAADNIHLKSEIKRLIKERDKSEQLNLKLSGNLSILKKRFIFKGSEKLNKDRPSKARKDDNLIIHNQTDSPPPSEEEEFTLKSESVYHFLEEDKCTNCGSPKIRKIKGQFEESMEIEVIERTYIQKRHKRQKYGCKSCEKIITAKGPLKLIPGGKFSIDMAIQVALDKFLYHIPLERQCREMAERGLKVDTKTLYSLTAHLESLLSEIPHLIKAEILKSRCVGMDESPFKILKTNKNGYIWVLRSNNGIYYQYELTRSGKVAQEIIGNYKGIVVTDGFGGYRRILKPPNVLLAGCWAHVRRRFYDSIDTSEEATEIVGLIDRLFDIEHRARSFEELKDLRRNESSKIVEKLQKIFIEVKNYYVKAFPIRKAIEYFYKNRKS